MILVSKKCYCNMFIIMVCSNCCSPPCQLLTVWLAAVSPAAVPVKELALLDLAARKRGLNQCQPAYWLRGGWERPKYPTRYVSLAGMGFLLWQMHLLYLLTDKRIVKGVLFPSYELSLCNEALHACDVLFNLAAILMMFFHPMLHQQTHQPGAHAKILVNCCS